jgi:hypothetical protein
MRTVRLGSLDYVPYVVARGACLGNSLKMGPAVAGPDGPRSCADDPGMCRSGMCRS